ncbi:MAG: aspartyl/asparaginyl beta-hydroxylase domain-containing protein, partial [Aestuariivirga sp.]
MADTLNTSSVTWRQRLRAARRKRVKTIGKKLTRGIGNFLGRQSMVGDTPVLDAKHFPFFKSFTGNWQAIQAEVREILKHREAIPAFQEISPDQKRISKGTSWRTFVLFGFGTKLEKNCSQAPLTARLLEAVPELQTAWFSILSPGYHIPPHRGVTKGIITVHLGLIIPRLAENCYLRVADNIKVWRPGEIFAFCDAYEHEVFNNTDEERVILLFHINRPMRFWGRVVNKGFLGLMKLTAFYQEPKKNMA